jgi:hypothetical protein
VVNQARVEYKALKFDTHSEMEEALNEWSAKGWQFVSYQAAGESVITHFLVLCREETRQRPMGFGNTRA